MNAKIKRELKRLAKRPLPELRAKFEEVTGEKTRSPNKTFILRKIEEGLEARAAAARDARRGRSRSNANEMDPIAAATSRGDGLTKMSVKELQALYLDVVGRGTGSEDKAYLIWKIREARKGRVRVGPAREKSAEAADLQNVPFTLPRTTVSAMDGARERLGFKSRQALLHHAMHELLVTHGEGEVAEHFKAAQL